MADCFGGELVVLGTVNQLKLVDLPTDALLCIFKFCDFGSLRNLSITCKRLYDITSEDCVWLKQSNRSIITNQLASEVIKRSLKRLKPREKCRISLNWKYGCYKEKFYPNNSKYMPWLQLEDSILWISQGRSILAIQRHKDGLKMQAPLLTIQPSHTEDISRFVKTDDFIFSGGKDKFICGWSITLKKTMFFQRSNHSQDIQGLDCKRNILVSGSKDSTIKVWRVNKESISMHCTQTMRVLDRVWCVAIDPSLAYLAAGSAGYYGVHPLHLYDLERGVEKPMAESVLKNGAAVFDIHWECPNTLLTCGFDSIIRLWDIRMGKCVCCWQDPFGAPGYCLASDLRYSVLCGTAHHGRAQLWDKRSQTSVQAYFGRSVASSPVYSLSFDPSHLFIAQDSCINVLDFTKHVQPNTQRADYSSYWTFKHRRR